MTTEKGGDNTNIERAIEAAKLQIQEGQLRLEEARLKLEKELHYLERWKVDVTPVEQVAVEAGKGSIAFAQAAIKSGLILNGGALVALPAFTQIFGISASQLIEPIQYFLLGIVLCGFASIFGFITLANTEDLLSCIRESRIIKLNQEHNPNLDKEFLKQRSDELRSKENKHRSRGKVFKIAGLLLIVLGYTAFCIGGISGINVFAHTASASKPAQMPTKK